MSERDEKATDSATADSPGSLLSSYMIGKEASLTLLRRLR